MSDSTHYFIKSTSPNIWYEMSNNDVLFQYSFVKQNGAEITIFEPIRKAYIKLNNQNAQFSFQINSGFFIFNYGSWKSNLTN